MNGCEIVRQTLEKQLKNGRLNLFLVLIFTVLDMVLIITESTYSFPFSVYFPQVVVSIIKYFDLGSTGTIIGIAVIFICLGAYFLFAVLADKHHGFLVGALVLFSVDTIMVFVFAFTVGDMIIDILFHLWVLYYLIMAIRAGIKLSKLPPEPVEVQMAANESVGGGCADKRRWLNRYCTRGKHQAAACRE